MSPLPAGLMRVTVDGKFFRLGESKFFVKGVTYGPFAASEEHGTFAPPQQTARDFGQIRELGVNVLRVYHVPPKWFLDLALEHELRVLVDIPWRKDLCFLDSPRSQSDAKEAIRKAVRSCERHAAVFAFSVVNEVPPDIVRWSGAAAVSNFIDELIDEAKSIDAECLCTFGAFPPTEYLRSANADFLCFNIYLHHPKPFDNYLARLQMLADTRPLVLGEFGMDSIREGEEKKSAALGWQIEAAFRAGLAGTIIFSFTDDWHRGAQPITDWNFGLTTVEREPKPSFEVVQRVLKNAPYFPLPTYPKVSVVVASYNGARTLKTCLDSLSRLNYPDYEVILVDDGSTDRTPEIAQAYSQVQYVRQSNLGLSVARNTGIRASAGAIVAFTDSDCRADEDWLYYMVGDLLRGDFAGIGGHNLLPPEDSSVAAAVLVSPGGPAHVMLTDREAEHVPGCNMAFWRDILIETGGFDPAFRKAGDDVDICWRIMELGWRIGFSPAGFVWHYRRSTVAAYLKQQAGYGEAEALLARKHPEYFSPLGGSIWRGRIYTHSRFGLTLSQPVIYHGLFGSGLFQKLYAPTEAHGFMVFTSLEYHVLVSLPLIALSISIPALWPVATASVLMTLAVCVAAAAQAELPRKKRRAWSRALVALLFLLQPIVRGWARYRWRLVVRPLPREARRVPPPRGLATADLQTLYYWSEKGVNRYSFLEAVIARLDHEGWETRLDTGWSDYDAEIYGEKWARLRLTTVTEDLPEARTLLRCRLEANWSLRAKLLFWSLFGAQLILIGLLRQAQPWLWMLLLTVPLAGWYFEQEKRNLQAMIAAVLDVTAARLEMVKLTSSKSGEQLVRV